ncbi:MAG: prepilin peptidase [Lachnospiraceae bacterium]|nr:prepilin peptidase [Lachnospiraceae bacterium]
MICSILIPAIYRDMVTYKIPNYLCLLGCIAGFIYSWFSYGLEGILHSILGMALPVGILLLFFAAGVIGAGDVKLFSALGAFLHFGIVEVMLGCFILAAMYGVLVVAKGFVEYFTTKKALSKMTRIHLSIPIGISTLVYIMGGMTV